MVLAPHPYGVGDVFSTTFRILGRRFGLYVLLALVPPAFLVVVMAAAVGAFVVLGGGGLLLAAATGSSRQTDAALAAAVVGIIVFVVLSLAALVGYAILRLAMQGRMAVATLDSLDGRDSTYGSLKAATPGLFGRAAGLIGLYVLVAGVAYLVIGVATFAVVGGLVAAGARSSGSSNATAGILVLGLLLLGVALAVGLFFVSVKLTYPLVFLSQGRGPVEALKGSWGLTRHAFWRTFGYFFVAGLLVWAASMAVSMVTQLLVSFAGLGNPALTSGRSPTTEQLISLLVTMVPVLGVSFALSFVVQLLTEPFMMIYTALMYRDQQVRNANPGLTAPSMYPQQSPYGQPSAYGQQRPAYGQPANRPPAYGQPSNQPPYGQQRG